jgi:sulfoxide reductase heme-binding subunit YedZ
MSSAFAPIWITSRAAGIGALLLASLSMALGLFMSSPALRLKVPRLELRALHEALALGTLALLAVHGLALMADPVLKAGLAGVVVPFAAPYRPLATAAGQIAGLGLAGLGLTYYLRRRVGPARWRAAHRFIPAFWGLAVIHGLTVGTDAASPWLLGAIAPPVLAAGALLAVRVSEHAQPPAQADAGPASRAI